MDTMSTIARRLRALREQKGETQEQLSTALGFKDRQIISRIEASERSITAEELVQFADHYQQTLDYFTDPFRLEGEARFSWRKQADVSTENLLAFEQKAGRWIALYRLLARTQGEKPSPLGPRISLTVRNTFEEAAEMGEATAEQIGFEAVTGQRLKDFLEQLGILILYVDSISEISGAACQITSMYAMNVIFINRKESLYRRKFDLAHEFFHLLTWDVMAPRHFESVKPRGKEHRIERLADNFASGLLMPREALQPHLSEKPLHEINAWLNATATAFGVSSIALKHRLMNCGLLSAAERNAIDASKIRNNGGGSCAGEPPPLFSKRFISVVGKGIAEGQISVSKCCSLLELSPKEFFKLFSAHELQAPFEL
jgi:Zn-dependent peptidase ImmA (M78 family)